MTVITHTKCVSLFQGLAIPVSTGVLMATAFCTLKDATDTMTVEITPMNIVV